MSFIRYSEKNRSHTARVSFSVSGMLSFGEGARRRFGLDNYTHCVLYFDPDTRRVGVELTNDEKAEGARKLRHRKTGADIGAKSFADFFDLKFEQTMAFPVERDPDTGMLVFRLGEGKPRGSGKSSRGAATTAAAAARK